MARRLMLLLLVPLLTLMPMIYYHKLPLKGDCSCDRGISSLEKTRAQTMFVLPRNPLLALSGDEASVQLDVVLKNKPAPSFQIAGDLAAELKPTFIPEFHGFEMFVWSLPSPQAPLQSQVTWVSQMTSDRVLALKQLLLVWKGPVCIAVYATHVEEDLEILAPYMQRVDFHFVAASQGPYPVNAMRNVALDHARTRYVLMADIDFYPSGSISQLADHWSEKYVKSDPLVALVLPAFFCEGGPEDFPRDKQELIQKASTRACHPIHDDPGRIIAHNATNYPYFLKAVEPYLAVFEFPWEPYYIADKSTLPRYDARFAGYGNDKAVQTYEMSWRKFKFLVMPDSFVIHIEHEAGPWRLALNMDRKQLMDIMITTFFNDMRRRYGNPNSAKLEVPSAVHPTWGIRGEDCNSVCARTNRRCDEALSRSIDSCEVLERVGRCLFGCSDLYYGSDMPNMDVTRQICLSNAKPLDYPFSCLSHHHNTKRLCPCADKI